MQRETNCAKQKRIWRTVALGLMAVTVVLAVVLTISVRRKEIYGQRLSDTFDQSFGQLSGNVSNIATQLAKLRVSTSQPQQTLLLGSIWRLAGETQNALALLPLTEDVSQPLLTFINELGD